MDIESLRKAYNKSPTNSSILTMLLSALLEKGRAEEAFEVLTASEAELADSDERLVAGNVCIKANKPEEVASYCTGENGEELILLAKSYLATLNHKKGLDAYNKAISISPTLEDPKLEKSLKANVKEVSIPGKGNVVGFRVLSNDNAEEDEEDIESAVMQFLQPQESTVKFKDVGGLDDVKKQINRKIILPFQKPSLFQKFKKKSGGGVLMYGPPGCGKTLLARATAGECEAKFYNVAISDILDMWIGNSEKKLNAIFEQARRTAPSVIFFDELEALAGKRSYSTDSASSKIVSQFLSEMDGFSQNNQGVLILGATNVPWSIDPAFRRPGRFDRVQFVPPPDKEARESILKIIADERPMAKDVDYKFLAKMTPGFSGADLGNLIDTACDVAIEHSLAKGQEQEVKMEYLKEALQEIKSTTSEWLTTARNYAKYSNEGGQYDEVVEFLKKHGK